MKPAEWYAQRADELFREAQAEARQQGWNEAIEAAEGYMRKRAEKHGSGGAMHATCCNWANGIAALKMPTQRSLKATELTDEQVALIQASKVDPSHGHLNEELNEKKEG